MKRFFLLAFCASFFTQCAVTYKPIKPETVVFDAVDENDDLKFAYRYDALQNSGNSRLAKSQDKLGIRIIVAQITNKTGRTLNIARDMDLFTEAGEYPYLTDVKTRVKRFSQPVAPYLLYGLLFYAKLDCEEVGRDCRFSNIIPFGLGIAAVNMIIAGKANHDLKKEFEQYNIENRDIGPGQTGYAILALEIEDREYSPLKLELREVPER
jgi:hypothetical protein